MPFSEKTAMRIRETFSGTKGVEEKKMFGGIAFMVNDKMCVGVDKDDIIIRCDPEMYEELLSKNGARPFDLTGRPMKVGCWSDPKKQPVKKTLTGGLELQLKEIRRPRNQRKKK